MDPEASCAPREPPASGQRTRFVSPADLLVSPRPPSSAPPASRGSRSLSCVDRLRGRARGAGAGAGPRHRHGVGPERPRPPRSRRHPLDRERAERAWAPAAASPPPPIGPYSAIRHPLAPRALRRQPLFHVLLGGAAADGEAVLEARARSPCGKMGAWLLGASRRSRPGSLRCASRVASRSPRRITSTTRCGTSAARREAPAAAFERRRGAARRRRGGRR